MSRFRVIAAVVAVVALGSVPIAVAQPQSGIVRPTTEPAKPSLQLGAQLYAGNCASCHGIAGSGVAVPRPGAGDILGAGPSLRGVGALAADFYLRRGYMPLSSIHDQPGPDKVLFSNKEIHSLVQYVASLGRGPAIPHPLPPQARSRLDSRSSASTARAVTRSRREAASSPARASRRCRACPPPRSPRRCGSVRI